mmetsp:Transcript_41567/g.65985  ORF Transcript_41567/g.65985 Transcript_41567/m.65985 type:complete len:201 (-) Transcript_41567:3127-3729(-)
MDASCKMPPRSDRSSKCGSDKLSDGSVPMTIFFSTFNILRSTSPRFSAKAPNERSKSSTLCNTDCSAAEERASIIADEDSCTDAEESARRRPGNKRRRALLGLCNCVCNSVWSATALAASIQYATLRVALLFGVGSMSAWMSCNVASSSLPSANAEAIAPRNAVLYQPISEETASRDRSRFTNGSCGSPCQASLRTTIRS